MKKLALITGCAKGIGKSIALNLAKNNYDIIGTYNTSLEEVINLSQEIKFLDSNLYYYHLDLSKEEEITKFCNYIKEKYQNIDLIINNAALSLDCEFTQKTKEEFIKVLEVNLIAPFLLVQNLYNIMNNGIVINISSTDAISTYTKLNIDYSASKAALINLTKSLALILDNIKVYAICPNWVDTESIREMNPIYLKEEMERIGQKKLIKPISIANKINDIINSNLISGSIIVMEEENE